MHRPETDPKPRLRLAEERILRKWSQHQLAERIGTTYVNISRWERGMTKPGPHFRRKLCALYGKSEKELDLETEVDIHEVRGTSPHEQETAKHAPLVASNAIYDPAMPLLPTMRLVGRNTELAQIKQRLWAGGNVALTALNGLPGVGKTALSIALAHDAEIRAHFRDGVLWAALGPQPNIPGLLSRWGVLLGISAAEMAQLSSNEAWSKALHSAIGTRSMLLVIDDAWKREEALAFKIGGPNCTHLLTTRFPSIATSIAFDGALTMKELGEEESMTLLRLLVPGIDQEKQRAHDLVHAVGGLPLALTLMGNYLRKQAYGGPSRRISAALQRLSAAEERLQISETQGPVESHTSLAAETPLSLQSVIAVTDQQLHEEAHAALYALAVLPAKPDNFSEQAALTVAACSLETLDHLLDAGLLESNGSDRYTLHQTIADYARLHLKEEAAFDRLIAYAISYLEAHKKDYELLEIESKTMLAALEAANNLERQSALMRSAIAFAPFLLSRGIYQLAEQHIQRAYVAAMALNDTYGTVSCLLYLGEIAQKQGSYSQAEEYYQQGLVLARQLGDHERISALLTNLGWVTLKRGEYTRAEVFLQEGLSLARQIDNPERISALLEMLGSVAGSRGNYKYSEACLQEGLALARQIEDRERMCTILINLGVTAGEQGNHTQAEVFFKEGLSLAHKIGHREWISALLSNLGEVASEQAHYSQAEEFFKEGLALSRQLENREWVSMLLINLGLTLRKQGNYIKAEEYFKECLALALELGRPEITSTILYEYGNLYLNRRQIQAAEASFRQMLIIVPEGGQDLLALAQFGLAQVTASQGKLQEARNLGRASAITLEEMGHRDALEVRRWLDSING